MTTNNATPDTLKQAIQNALRESPTVECIEEHVIDYLAQKFGAAMMSYTDPAIVELWRRIKRGGSDE